MGQAMKAEIVKDPNERQRIEAAWRQLAVDRGNPFITPEWFDCALKHSPHPATPHLVAVHDHKDQLRGVMPMALIGEGRKRSMEFAGSRWADWIEPAAAPEDAEAVARAAAQALSMEPHVRSAPARMVRAHRDAAWIDGYRRGRAGPQIKLRGRRNKVPVIDIEGLDWDGYLKTRSRNHRKELRRNERRLAEAGSVTFRTANHETLAGDMDFLFELKDKRWGDLSGSSSMDESARHFHRDFARRALDQGWLRLCVLELDDKPIAVIYAYSIGGHYLDFECGFELEHEKLSPGVVLLNMSIREAMAEGALTYNLMLGAEPYKLRYTDSTHEVEHVELAPVASAASPSMAGRAFVRGAVRAVPERRRNELRKQLFDRRKPDSAEPTESPPVKRDIVSK